MKKPSAETPGSSLWPMTDWSGVGHAATAVGKDPDRLNRLILTYRVPLKVFLLSTFPALANQADEFLQDFAQDKILREGWLAHANRTRGRFRNFLKTSLRNFVMDRLRKAANPPISLDELDFDLAAKAPSDETLRPQLGSHNCFRNPGSDGEGLQNSGKGPTRARADMGTIPAPGGAAGDRGRRASWL